MPLYEERRCLRLNTYPLIGISGSLNAQETQYFLPRCYASALIAAGAVPVQLSPEMDNAMMDACLASLDGILLAGGNDMAPELFNQEPIAQLGEVNPLRDQFEMRLIVKAFQRQMPVLGICRGVQSMNVSMGGTLYQDLPSQYRTSAGAPPLCHNQTRPDHYTSHAVSITEGTLLARLVNTGTLQVNSFHHQAAAEAADGLIVSARASDGVIEALEHPDHPFFLGVQWHPERYHDRTQDAAVLFSALAEAARQHSARR